MSTVNKILARIEETKSITRRVRTPAGAKKYGQPIGSIIVPDPIPDAPRRKKAKRSATTPKISMAPNKPQVVPVAEARVAPKQTSVDLNEPRRPLASKSYPTRIPLVVNKAPFMERLDWDFLREGTADEAFEKLGQMGVEALLDEPFYTDREFMVALTETVRVMEEEFPGFIYRHGNVYSDMNLGGEVMAYNSLITRKTNDQEVELLEYGDRSKDLSGFRGIKDSPIDLIPDRNQTQTMTVVGPLTLSDASGIPYNHGISARTGFYSSNDGVVKIRNNVGSDKIAGTIALLVHEFGHGVSTAIGGHMSFELDGQKDKDQEKRRWYSEYYMDAHLDLLASVGVVKRTEMEVDASLLAPLVQGRAPGRKVKIDLGKYSDEPFPTEVDERISDLSERIMKEDLDRAEGFAVMKELSGLLKDLEAWKARNTDHLTAWSLLSAQPRSKPYDAYLRVLSGDGYIERGGDAKKMTNVVSRYANTSWMETEAEIWSSYMLDTEVTEVTARWGAVMDEMFSWWNAEDTTNGQEG